MGSLRFTRNGEGTFEIFSVLPGSYLLVAHLTDGGQQRTATLPIDVKDRSVDGVSMQAAVPRDVTATVALDDKPYTNGNGLFVNLMTVDGTNGAFSQGMFGGSVFKFQNVSAAPYAVNVSNLPQDCACFVKSITYGGKEIPESGAVLTGGSAGDRARLQGGDCRRHGDRSPWRSATACHRGDR